LQTLALSCLLIEPDASEPLRNQTRRRLLHRNRFGRKAESFYLRSFSAIGIDVMSKDRDRTIYRRADDVWVNKRNDADRASSLHRTQAEAAASGKALLGRQGGGELSIKGVDGKIRSKDTIVPGHDPNPPKDREH
jgi:hypothetical protein